MNREVLNREALAQLMSNTADARPVLVCGLGITGIETALWLRREGLPVICVERMSRSQYEAKDKFHRIEELQASGAVIHFGIDGEGLRAVFSASVTPRITTPRIAVLSPGISLASPLVGTLRGMAIPCISEMELGILISQVPCICVTGSNGKTTTVSLLAHVLASLGKRPLLCGNVGRPIVAELGAGDLAQGLTHRFDWLVVEASSYQLEGCEVLAPEIGVVLNLSDNHLERHGSMERYRDAKISMLLRQQAASQNVSILNRDDPWLAPLLGRLPGKVCTFGRSQSSGSESVQIDQQVIRWANGAGMIDVGAARLRGAHNRENIAAVIAVLLAMGEDPAVAQDGILSFNPIEHRLESVPNALGLHVINDSKSTTVAASVAAVRATRELIVDEGRRNQSNEERKIVLCLGGCAKAGSWKPLMEELISHKDKIRFIVCFGQDGTLIADHLSGELDELLSVAPTMASGVATATHHVAGNDVLLFSPGCASFDEFLDFEHRGREFKKLFVVANGDTKTSHAASVTRAL